MNLLQLLNKEELSKIKEISVLKDQILFNENDLCDCIGVISEGELKIVSYLENGKEVIYNDLGVNQVFGNNLLFSSEPFFRGDVIAKKDSKVYIIEKDALLYLLKNNEKFLIAYLNNQSDFGKQLNLNIKLLTLNNAKDRILYYLSINKDKIRYKSISDLANMLFLTREATSRELHRLEKEKIIKINAKEIVKI